MGDRAFESSTRLSILTGTRVPDNSGS